MEDFCAGFIIYWMADLSTITLGILGSFYVNPYVYLTGAALYRKLRGSDEIPQNVYFEGMEFDAVQDWYEKP